MDISTKSIAGVPLKRRWSTGNCALSLTELSTTVMAASALFHAERLSPSRVSIDSGFVSADSSFPGSPESSSQATPNHEATFDDHVHPLEASLPSQSLNFSAIEEHDEPEPKRRRAELSPEAESESTSIKSTFSIPKEEPEPKPETASTLQIECPPSTSKIDVAKLFQEAADSYGWCHCEWMECKKKYSTDNELYDHVIKAHLDYLRPVEIPKSPTKGRRGNRKNAQDQAIVTPKNEDDEEHDKYECRWGECEMTLTRGDDNKKFEWLVNHYTTRHAPRAQPYGCVFEGCSSRFRTQKMLVDHVRTAHDDTKPVRKQTEEKVQIEPKTCYAWKPIVHVPSYFGIDYLDQRSREWVQDKVKEIQETKKYDKVSSPRTLSESRKSLHSISNELADRSKCEKSSDKSQLIPKKLSVKKTAKTIVELFGDRKRKL